MIAAERVEAEGENWMEVDLSSPLTKSIAKHAGFFCCVVGVYYSCWVVVVLA